MNVFAAFPQLVQPMTYTPVDRKVIYQSASVSISFNGIIDLVKQANLVATINTVVDDTLVYVPKDVANPSWVGGRLTVGTQTFRIDGFAVGGYLGYEHDELTVQAI